MTEIEDIQIRLRTEVEGITFVCSWYGPKDKMRFAALRCRDREMGDEEITQLEKEARERFTEAIQKLERKLGAWTEPPIHPESL